MQAFDADAAGANVPAQLAGFVEALDARLEQGRIESERDMRQLLLGTTGGLQRPGEKGNTNTIVGHTDAVPLRGQRPALRQDATEMRDGGA